MLNIIHETKDIIIVNKPAGQLSQGAKGFDLDLVSEVMTYNASQGKPAYAAIINRLDRPVSGLVLIAKNKSAAAKYSTLMQKDGGFNKQYEALICGKLSELKGTFVDYLKKDGRTNTSAIVPADAAANDKEAKLSKLEYEVISYDEVKDITHVRIHLITGRHHQIRVQFASRRNPPLLIAAWITPLKQWHLKEIRLHCVLFHLLSIIKLRVLRLSFRLGDTLYFLLLDFYS